MKTAPKYRILAIILSVLGCSGGGKDANPVFPNPGGNDEKPEPDPPKAGVAVNFDFLARPVPLEKKCVFPLKEQSLKISQPIKIDGDFSDWGQNIGRSFSDPKGDVQGNLDITDVRVAYDETNLYVALPGLGADITDDTYIYLEFYRGFKKDDTVTLSWQHVVRINRNTFEIFESGVWQSLPEHFVVEKAVTTNGTEIQISQEHFLSGVTTAPMWGIIASTGSAGNWHDFTGLMLFPGSIDSGYRQFSFGGCEPPEELQSFALHYQTVIGSGNMEQAGDLIRFAESRLAKFNFVGQQFPVSFLPIVGAKSNVALAPLAKNKGSGTFSDYGPLPLLIVRGDGPKFGVEGQDGYVQDPEPKYLALEFATRKYLDILLYSKARRLSQSLRDTVSLGITSRIVSDTLGLVPWAEFLTRSRDLKQKSGIMLEYRTLAKDSKGAQNLALAWIAAGQKKSDDADPDDDPDSSFWAALAAELPNGAAEWEKIRESAKGDPNGDNYLSKQFSDTDFDGLPFFVEEGLGTDPSKLDSDGDGWSDLAELAFKTDARNASSRPESLYPDGSFGDVLDLMPGKIVADQDDRVDLCSGAGNIKSFAVVADNEKVMIAISHAGGAVDYTSIPNENDRASQDFRWEIDLVDPAENGHKARIRASRRGRGFDLLDGSSNLKVKYRSPVPTGVYAVEIVVPLDVMGIAKLGPDAKFQIRSYRADTANTFCDETPTFAPLIWAKEER